MLTVPSSDADQAKTKDGPDGPNTPEDRLAMTNTAYDCLSNADKFSEFQSRLAAGDSHLPDLDSLLTALGESAVKPVAARVLAKRHAQLQERMERITILASESVKKAGHDEALRLTQGKLPDADRFYDSVYKAARDAGNRTCVEEMAELAKTKLEMDDTFKSELDSHVVDQAEMIAHKEYDRLEDRAARSAPTPAMPRFVALTLSIIIMGLVVSMCFWGATSPPIPVPNGQYPVATAPAAGTGTTTHNYDQGNTLPTAQVTGAPAALSNAMPAAPAAGIANSVFNRSVFGPNNGQNASTTSNPVNSGVATLGAPAAVLHPITAAESSGAEIVTEDKSTAVPPVDASSALLVSNAGAAGLAGYATGGTKPGGALYVSGIDSALKQTYVDSLRDFTEAYAAGHAKEALYNQGVVLALQGQFQPSVDAYSQLLAVDPAFPQALYNRALGHQLLARAAGQSKNTVEWRKQLAMAIKNYTLAAKVDPRMSQALYNRGLAYHDLGQMEKASADFAKTGAPPFFMPAAAYNLDVTNYVLKKVTAPPSTPPPPAPIGPVGPPGPA
jgi:tetratricopeptide (TPR) repeat protein